MLLYFFIIIVGISFSSQASQTPPNWNLAAEVERYLEKYPNDPYGSFRKFSWLYELNIAAAHGRLDVVKFRLAQDDYIEMCGYNCHFTPLMLAVDGGHLEIAAYLLSQKPAMSNHRGYRNTPTPLQIARKNNNLEMAKLLLNFHKR